MYPPPTMTARRPGAKLGAQPLDVGSRAQVMDPGEFRAGHWQESRTAAGGQQQFVVFQVRAVGDLHPAP